MDFHNKITKKKGLKMKKMLLLIQILIIKSGFSATIIGGDYKIETGFVVAPNSESSPSWGGFLTNFSTYFQNGLEVGIDAEAFEVAGPYITPGNVTSTSSFNNWNGVENPTGNFAGEFGSRVHHYFIAKGKTKEDKITLNDVSYQWTSDDGVLNLTGDLTGTNYSGSYIGIDYGGDGLFGGGDDTYSSLGQSGSDDFNAIAGIGPGNGYAPFGSGDNQQQMDNIASDIDGMPGGENTLTAEYTFFDGTAGAINVGDTVNISSVPVPEMAGIPLIMGTLSSLLLFLRRR